MTTWSRKRRIVNSELRIFNHKGGKKMIMKKKMFGLLALPFAVALTLAGCSDNSGNVSVAKEEVIELDINNWASSTHHYAYNIYEPWKELVEEKQTDV